MHRTPTLAFVLPYRSYRLGVNPAAFAISEMGTGVVAWAMSISDGTGDLHSNLTIFLSRGTTRSPAAQALHQEYVTIHRLAAYIPNRDNTERSCN